MSRSYAPLMKCLAVGTESMNADTADNVMGIFPM